MVQTKLFLDMYLTKFLNSLVKPFFTCNRSLRVTVLYVSIDINSLAFNVRGSFAS